MDSIFARRLFVECTLMVGRALTVSMLFVEGGPALGAGGIVGLMLVLLLVLALAVDAAFCKTKQCGLLWTLNGLIGRQEEGSTAAKSPEDGSVSHRQRECVCMRAFVSLSVWVHACV